MESLYENILFEKKNADVGLENKADILLYKDNEIKVNSTRYYILRLQSGDKLSFEAYFDMMGNVTGGREAEGNLARSISGTNIENFLGKYGKPIAKIAKIMPKNICSLINGLFLSSEKDLEKTMKYDNEAEAVNMDDIEKTKPKYLPSC